MEFLSFNGLCHIVGISQYTAENWIKEFNIYIPRTQQHDETHYLPEAIDILRLIKKCKYQNYGKNEIMELLSTGESAKKDVQRTAGQNEYQDNILPLMQTIGITVSHAEAQEKAIQKLQEQQMQQKKIMKKQAKEMKQLKQEIQALKQWYTPAKEYEMKKLTMAKLFEKQRAHR